MEVKQSSRKKKGIPSEPVPMVDLRAQFRDIGDTIEKTLREIFRSGHFILGKHVRALEEEIAGYLGVKYAVGLASCTDALHLCLKSLDIKEGDEVITTPFTFIATAEAIAYLGAIPVFVDIDGQTLNIDTSKIEEKITGRTRAIVPVHIFGQPSDMDSILSIAQRYRLKVIEDSAQAFGSRYKGIPAGGMGDAGCFSFYPSKNLGCYGDGGMAVTSDHALYEKISLLRNHGTTGPYRHRLIGYNSRLDEIQAAILRVKLGHIDDYNRRRKELAKIYSSLLSGFVQCPAELPERVHVYHQYTIRSKRREEIKKTLQDNSVSSVVYYPVPLHLQEAFHYLGYKKGDLPEAEAASEEVLSLPIYPELEPEKAEFIARAIVQLFKG